MVMVMVMVMPMEMAMVMVTVRLSCGGYSVTQSHRSVKARYLSLSPPHLIQLSSIHTEKYIIYISLNFFTTTVNIYRITLVGLN